MWLMTYNRELNSSSRLIQIVIVVVRKEGIWDRATLVRI
jgi:hypothetical protein